VCIPISLKIALFSYYSVLLQYVAAFRLQGRGKRTSWTFISTCHVNANGTYCQSLNVWFCSLETAFVLTRQAMHIKRNIEARSHNHFCSGKAISITYSECVCLQTQLSNMQCACSILSFVASPSLLYFQHYIINGTICEKRKVIGLKMCFDFLYNCCLKHL
jgi:hypothetical protein